MMRISEIQLVVDVNVRRKADDEVVVCPNGS